eukprot:1154746-Pelagomonas_calceolata.AAC.3
MSVPCGLLWGLAVESPHAHEQEQVQLILLLRAERIFWGKSVPVLAQHAHAAMWSAVLAGCYSKSGLLTRVLQKQKRPWSL